METEIPRRRDGSVEVRIGDNEKLKMKNENRMNHVIGSLEHRIIESSDDRVSEERSDHIAHLPDQPMNQRTNDSMID